MTTAATPKVTTWGRQKVAMPSLPSMPTIPPVVVWVVVCSGAWLLYSAVRGLSPIAEFKAALQGLPSPGPQATPATTTAAPAEYAGLLEVDTSNCTVPAELVPIGQGGHRLIPQAARAMATAEKAFGEKITVTDSYRSCEQQARAKAEAEARGEFNRFGSAASSGHPKGLCIDVNLKALKADPGIKSQEPKFRRLFTALTAAGFHNPRGPYDAKGDKAEPWHFSWGVRI